MNKNIASYNASGKRTESSRIRMICLTLSSCSWEWDGKMKLPMHQRISTLLMKKTPLLLLASKATLCKCRPSRKESLDHRKFRHLVVVSDSDLLKCVLAILQIRFHLHSSRKIVKKNSTNVRTMSRWKNQTKTLQMYRRKAQMLIKQSKGLLRSVATLTRSYASTSSMEWFHLPMAHNFTI